MLWRISKMPFLNDASPSPCQKFKRRKCQKASPVFILLYPPWGCCCWWWTAMTGSSTGEMNSFCPGRSCRTCHSPLSSAQKKEPANAAKASAGFLLKTPAKELRPLPSAFTVSMDWTTDDQMNIGQIQQVMGFLFSSLFVCPRVGTRFNHQKRSRV